MDIGTFSRGTDSREGLKEPEFYTLPVRFIREHHNKSSSWEKVRLGNQPLDKYKNERGFELIAKALKVSYPGRFSDLE